MLTRFRKTARRACALVGQKWAAPIAVKYHRRPAPAAGETAVHMLISSRTWDAGLLAAVSLEHHSGRRWSFFFHDDGTLDRGAFDSIRAAFSDARLIPRAEADARAGEYLSQHPKCLLHRSNHNLFLKFFDFAAWTSAERFVVLDSDVIFFRHPVEIIEWSDTSSDGYHYNEDTKEKYCIPRDHLERGMGLSMWPRFNSGLLLLPKAALSLDLAEKLLTKFEESAHHPQFFEQTLYAIMGSAWSRGGALPKKYEINWGYFRGRGAVCRHYVGAFKHDLLFIEGASTLLASILKRRLLVLE